MTRFPILQAAFSLLATLIASSALLAAATSVIA